MRYEEFRALLARLSAVIDNQPEPSAHKTNKSSPRPPDADGSPSDEAWWLLARTGTSPARSRTQAFLTAYIAAAGASFSASGILLENGYVWPDRDIMKCLLEAGLVRFENSQFQLTPQGVAYLRKPSSTHEI